MSVCAWVLTRRGIASRGQLSGFKQTPGWTVPKIRDPQAADRWAWLIIACDAQLWLRPPRSPSMWVAYRKARPNRVGSPGTGPPRISERTPSPGPQSRTR